jgi:catechol 2,3-dioxygenase-like lactoylglutathione lyase family enzyme
MLHHVALTVIDSEEIRKFYEEVLQFSLSYSFSLDSIDVLRELFSTEKQTEVYIMKRENLKLEIFIDHVKEKKRFSHICLDYLNSSQIFKYAVQLGYRTWIKKNPHHFTYFIWDKSGNLFEIKEREDL